MLKLPAPLKCPWVLGESTMVSVPISISSMVVEMPIVAKKSSGHPQMKRGCPLSFIARITVKDVLCVIILRQVVPDEEYVTISLRC